MNKKTEGNWDDKRPDTGERLSSGLSIRSSWSDSLGGLPELTTADIAAAVGAIHNALYKIVLGARYANWEIDRGQLSEIVTRRSWALWHEHKRKGNLNAPLNERVAELVLSVWYLPPNHRSDIGDTVRAKRLGVDYRRYKGELKTHTADLLIWLDAVTLEALAKARLMLRK